VDAQDGSMSRRADRSRQEQITGLFMRESARIERLVAARVKPEHFAADGCAYAWGRLAEQSDVRLENDGKDACGWVFQVALREAWNLANKQLREQSLEAIQEQSDEVPSLERTPLERALAREKLELLNELSPERREVVLMDAAGLSHKEISDIKDMTERQVTRHLHKSRDAMRRADLQRSSPQALRTPGSTRPIAPSSSQQHDAIETDPPSIVNVSAVPAAPATRQLAQLELGLEL